MCIRDSVLPGPGVLADSSGVPNPWLSWKYISGHYDAIEAATRQHISLTLVSVSVGLLISFPLALLATRRRRTAGPILALAGVLYTIPSLALFRRAGAGDRAQAADGGDRADGVHTGDPGAQRRRRTGGRAGRRGGGRARAGLRVPAAVAAGGAAARAAGDPGRAAGRHRVHDRADDHRRVRRVRRARGPHLPGAWLLYTP